MPDLHGWITQQIDEVEREQREGRIVLDGQGQYTHTEFSPDPAVLRRVAADRKMLVEHAPQQDGSGFPDSQQCRTCSKDGGDGYQYLVPYPCPTVLAVAEGYGSVEERPNV